MTPAFTLGRRALLAFAAAAALLVPGLALADTPTPGGTLTFNIGTEPPVLLLLAHTAGSAYATSGKTNEGLLTYDSDFNPQPLLATEWQVAPDGLRYWFRLREGVRFHDGTPFTAEDVKFSFETLREHHPRGRATFAPVEQINLLGSHEIELILSRPAPYLLNALASFESPIVPRHVYEGTDIASNPNNTAPIGTGPFVFKEWVRGSHVLYERNPDYWDAGKPYLDQLVIRFISDPASAVAAIETGEVQLSTAGVPLIDIQRLQQDPRLTFETRGFEYSNTIYRLEFNLENEILADHKVRQAIAHAINRDFIVDTIYYGHAKPLYGPVSPNLAAFYTDDLPRYDFDLARAEALLDDAGYPRKADGVRFEIFIDPVQPAGPPRQGAEYLAQILTGIGVKTTLRTQDFATYVKRVYTDRDFDLAYQGMSNLFDPTVGIQRLYWSKNFLPGVPFSNGAKYFSAETDRLLEAAAIEPNPQKRHDLFVQFQRQVVTDLPAVDIVAPDSFTIAHRQVRDHTIGVEGVNSNGAHFWIAQD